MKENVAEIVAAYVRRNAVAQNDLPALISSVSQALSVLGQSPALPGPPEVLTPAVSVRRSVGADAITCLECGHKGAMLKRHLMTAHAMTPETYRDRWKLSFDYPMVAPNYANRRSELAKSIGLGKRAGNRRGRAKS